MTRIWWFAPFVFVVGCAQPVHLGFDYGRAYSSGFNAQADLTRPSVATMKHHLYGKEAEAIRIKVTTSTGAGGGGAGGGGAAGGGAAGGAGGGGAAGGGGGAVGGGR